MKMRSIFLIILFLTVSCGQGGKRNSILKSIGPKSPITEAPGSIMPGQEDSPDGNTGTEPGDDLGSEGDQDSSNGPGDDFNPTPETDGGSESASSSFKDKIIDILNRIKSSPVEMISFNHEIQRANLSRPLTTHEVSAGKSLSLEMAQELDNLSGNNNATSLLNDYYVTMENYSRFCSTGKSKTIQNLDGESFDVVKSGKDLFLVNKETGERGTESFKNFKAACDYVVKDSFSVKYKNSNDMEFPLVFSAEGYIQSASGVVKEMFCKRTFKKIDGLDTDGKCK